MRNQKRDLSQLVTKQEYIDKIIAGDKTAIRRNDRYADEGDTFILNGVEFVIKNVYEQKLGDMTETQAKQEGFPSLEAYKASLTFVHRGAVWDPNLTVWVHEMKAK